MYTKFQRFYIFRFRYRLQRQINVIISMLVSLFLKPPNQRLGNLLFSTLGDGDGDFEWICRDERWVRVAERRIHRSLLRHGRSFCVLSGDCDAGGRVVSFDIPDVMVFDRSLESSDEWTYLYLSPDKFSLRNFRWSFHVKRDSDFRELQFGFRYIDFYNRYRIRHEDGVVHFDMVRRGAFYNSVAHGPLVMLCGQVYYFELDAVGNRFVLRVDGKVVIDMVDIFDVFHRGSVAIILWENDGKTPIMSTVSGLRLHELVP